MCVQVTKTANRFDISSLWKKILLKQLRWCLTFVGLYIMVDRVGKFYLTRRHQRPLLINCLLKLAVNTPLRTMGVAFFKRKALIYFPVLIVSCVFDSSYTTSGWSRRTSCTLQWRNYALLSFLFCFCFANI